MVPEALAAKRRPGRRAAKEVINTRLSQEVLSAFRARAMAGTRESTRRFGIG